MNFTIVVMIDGLGLPAAAYKTRIVPTKSSKTFLAFLVNSFQFNYTLVVSLTTNVRQVYHSLSSFHP